MADTQQLTATSNSSNQETTQNPQTANSSGGGAGANDFQPTAMSSTLTSSVGVPLQPTAVTTVPLAAATATTIATAPVNLPVPTHHLNAALLSLPALFLVVGIAVFMGISRSAKTTTS